MEEIILQPLELEDLTSEQFSYFINNIWNGVGSRDYAFDPPDLVFGPCSIRHDFYYYRGGTEEHRKFADKKFLADALEIAKKQCLLKQPFYYCFSYIYYTALVLLGGAAFEYYPEPAKTWEEFLERVNNYNNKQKTTRQKFSKALARRVYRRMNKNSSYVYGRKSVPKSI